SRSSSRSDIERFNSSPRACKRTSPSSGSALASGIPAPKSSGTTRSALPKNLSTRGQELFSRTRRERRVISLFLRSKGRQKRQAILRPLAFFDLDLLDENARGDGGNGDAPGFCAA